MTVMIMTLVLLLGVSSACSAREAQDAQEAPKLQVEETHVKLGSIFKGDTTTHLFKLKNVGSAALNISRIKSHCRCATSVLLLGSTPEEIKPDQKGAFSADSLPSLAPGETAELRLTLDTEGLPAREYTKNVKILSNDPELPEFGLSYYFTVALPAETEPKRLDFGEIPQGKAQTLSSTLTIHEDMEFSFVDASSIPGMTTELRQLEEDGAAKTWTLAVTATGDLPVGSFIAPITVTTDHPKVTKIQLQAYGTVLSPLRFTPGDGEVKVLTIGAVEPTQGATKTITVRNIEPEKPLAITAVTIEGMRKGLAELRLRTIEEGVSYEIDVTILAGQEHTGQFSGDVVVTGEGLEEGGHKIRFRGVLR